MCNSSLEATLIFHAKTLGIHWAQLLCKIWTKWRNQLLFMDRGEFIPRRGSQKRHIVSALLSPIFLLKVMWVPFISSLYSDMSPEHPVPCKDVSEAYLPCNTVNASWWPALESHFSFHIPPTQRMRNPILALMLNPIYDLKISLSHT